MAQPPGTTILYLVRHGQTEANAQNLICGDAESPLNEKGRKQAVDLAEQMAEIDFDIAYTSPLSRASDTCDAILAGRDVEKIVTRDLREQDFGEWEMLNYKTIMQEHPEAFKLFSEDPYRAKAPGGETLAEFRDRVRRAFYDEIIPKHTDERVLITSHGGTMRAALCLLMDLPIEKYYYRFDIHNASLCVVQFGKMGGRLLGLNLRKEEHWHFEY